MTTIVIAGGSVDRGETTYTRAAREFGRRVAERGWTLRTGGGAGHSVMGAASDGAIAAGGRVEGVILQKFWRVRHRGLHRLRSTTTFALRKAGLFRRSDAAVIFPGGFGTLDEFGDLLALKQNGYLDIPLILLNTAGFYDELLRWARRAKREGFLYGGELYEVAKTPRQAVSRLAEVLGSKF